MSRYFDRLVGLAGPMPLVRRLATQSVLSATGDGVFLTGSAVFFTQIVGLSASQVGLGLTISGVATFALAVPLGSLSDRYGARRTWAVASLLEAITYLFWLGIGDFAAYTAITIALVLIQTTSRAARNAYRLDVFPRSERVASQAYFRAARNIGYTLGALLAGVALATGSDTVVRGVPLVTAGLLLLNSGLVVRLPRAALAEPESAPRPAGEPAGEPPVEEALEHAGDRNGALRNRGFLAMSVCDGVLGTHQVLLNVVIPLWLVEQTDAPRVLLAWLFATNTVMAVLLQVAAARGVTTVAESLRAERRGAALFVVSCAIVLVTHDTLGWLTIVLVWVGHVTVSGAELLQSAGEWGLQAELSDSRRRGEYQGVAQLGYTLGTVWAPAVYTYLALDLGSVGWIAIAAIVVVAAVGLHPATRAAERHFALVGATA